MLWLTVFLVVTATVAAAHINEHVTVNAGQERTIRGEIYVNSTIVCDCCNALTVRDSVLCNTPVTVIGVTGPVIVTANEMWWHTPAGDKVLQPLITVLPSIQDNYNVLVTDNKMKEGSCPAEYLDVTLKE